MKVYVLIMGKNLYYVSKSEEDAEYEKSYTEEETFQGRKLGIKSYSITVDENNPEEKIKLGNWSGTVQDILDIM